MPAPDVGVGRGHAADVIGTLSHEVGVPLINVPGVQSFEAAFLEKRQVVLAELARAARGRLGVLGAGWELRLFFALWALSLVHGWCRPHLQAWREQLSLAALLCLGLPLLSALTLQRPWADSGHLLLELTAAGIGLLLAWTARRIGQHGTQPLSRRAARPLAEAN